MLNTSKHMTNIYCTTCFFILFTAGSCAMPVQKQEVPVMCDKHKQVDDDRVNGGISSAVLFVLIKMLHSRGPVFGHRLRNYSF